MRVQRKLLKRAAFLESEWPCRAGTEVQAQWRPWNICALLLSSLNVSFARRIVR